MSLELRQMTKFDRGHLLYPTNLKLESGTFNILLGPTLSGKTTLMRLMAGLDSPTQGEIWLKGKNITKMSVQKRQVSMVYQQFINYPDYTVFENIASPLKVARIAPQKIKQQVYQMAELLKLEKWLDRKPHQLSGGQQQRTAIARALIKNAGLVLLDEPLANLDYKLREELRDELPRLFNQTKAIIVYATTEPGEALMLGGTTSVLHEGKIKQHGPTLSVYQRPHDLISAEIFSDPPLNLVPVKRIEKKIMLNSQTGWAAPPSTKNRLQKNYTLALRPHHLTLNRTSTRSVCLKMEVEISEISGSQTLLHLTQKGNKWLSQLPGIHDYQPGEQVKIYLDIAQAIYFDSKGQLVETQ